jgi:hypothetical protein
MSRSQRRAAAHAARKAERKAGFTTPVVAETNATVESTLAAAPLPANPVIDFPQPEPSSTTNISAAQLAANRANAQLSHGPTSSEGRKKVSQNALKTGLTGEQVLLPTDDAARYESLVAEYQAHFQPVGPEETHLVQSIVDTRWRLARIPSLESALLDLGRRNLVDVEPALADNPKPVLDMQIRIHLEKDLRNLHLQENRLVRRREREMKELRELQAARRTETGEATKKAAAPVSIAVAAAATNSAAPNDPPAQNGFVFTTSRINEYLATLAPANRIGFLLQALNDAAVAEQTQAAAA